MAQICDQCSRPNPAEAVYCYYDGKALPGHTHNGGVVLSGSQQFPKPIVLPSGRACASFDELALHCQHNWAEARQVLQQGHLESFLGGLGRADLALAAREAARFPDGDRGLDRFLGKLPSAVLEPPQLRVEPLEVNLGQLRIGQSRRFELRLRNGGMRLIYGSVICDHCAWLAVGDGPGAPEKLFEFGGELVIPVQVRGQHLRAGVKPLQGRLVIDSNGGSTSVLVTAHVPVTPFPRGVLAGAITPRQVAEKAKAAPKGAAVLLESGAVAQWYKDNGWDYPIQGQLVTGLGAVQQFFEALGLTPPPRVEVSERAVTLHGRPGEQLKHPLEVRSQEKRPVWVHGTSDQPWLEVGRARLQGRTASVSLIVPGVPERPGETLHAEVTLMSNGNQRFVVPVALVIGAGSRPARPQPVYLAEPELITTGVQRAPLIPVFAPEPEPWRGSAPAAPAALPVGPRRPLPAWAYLLPTALLAMTLLGLVVRDILVKPKAAAADDGLVDPEPRIAIRLHDGKKGDELDKLVPEPSMRFGLVMLDPGNTDAKAPPKRLTFDEWGRTNNTCLLLDGQERLFGSPPGRWLEQSTDSWKDDRGRRRGGARSVWVWDDKKVQVTQFVELVPGEQSGLLDTCLVRYRIENRDAAEHRVGIRLMLDTYIGGNDGVPFTIPGEPDLCTDSKEFEEGKIPDFIQALEHEDLAHPGTVAHLKLKLGDKEPPSRVTLGAWPDDNLQRLRSIAEAKGPNTLWRVPVLPMKTLWPYDSAVVIYWNDKPLPAHGSREVGVAYGLGSVSSSGKLLMTIDGTFKPGGDLTVTALVSNPAAGETLTLSVPEGFRIDGDATQTIPDLTPDSASRNRPVTWRLKAGPVGRHDLEVRSSAGAAQTKTVTIKASSIFD
ncbi:MAG TPA: hypothetical protein VG013_42165 [Gemmataceae bacterium]|nr:hypothetical protein [Gemmataceae bacterium]